MGEQRVSVWILGDQLLAQHPAVEAATAAHGAEAVRVVMVESSTRLRRLPYHRKKLTILLSAMRHYADRLRSQGCLVDYQQADTFSAGLRQHVSEHNPAVVYTMAASAYGGRRFQQTGLSELVRRPVHVHANTQFLTGRFDPYPDPQPGKRIVMEYFYREMRRHFGLLLDDEGEPVGGEWNLDKQNRRPLPRGLTPPDAARFEPDAVTQDVMQEIGRADVGWGALDGFDLAVTHEQAQRAFDDFLDERLAQFGPFEDAMSKEYAILFHSALSPYLNLGLLEPLPLAIAAEKAYSAGKAPLNSVEGFVRQLVGWREYMYWQYWRSMPSLLRANSWQADRSLPAWFWDGETQMECLRTVLRRVEKHGYAHHIERLMILSNFGLMAGLRPQEMNDWFTAGFVDAYEWVMAPNVLGMGLHADGGQIATKPYMASANYINKMSDFCRACAYDNKQRTGPNACPFNTLYWRFLVRHEEELRANPRSGRNVLGLRNLDEQERRSVVEQGDAFLADL